MAYTIVKTKTLVEKVYNGLCPDCKSENSIVIFITVKYHSAYNILPFFPEGKGGATVCKNCIKTYDIDDSMDEELCASFQETYNQVKTPIWTYLGSILALILFTYIFLFK